MGAFAEQIQPLLAFANVEITKNENWQKGMSSSLQKSLELTQNNDAVLVLLSDQPFVNTTLVNLIIEKATGTDLPIITTKYNNIVGVPLLFKRAVFPILNALNEQESAKKVIRQYFRRQQVGIMNFEKAAIHIDTIEDYERLLKEI